MSFDKGIDYISHRNALHNRILITKLIIFLIVMPCAMGFDKGIDYISHHNALQWVLIKELIIFLILMPCALGFEKGIDSIFIVLPCDGF